MTLQIQEMTVVHIGNGVATSFSFEFPVPLQEYLYVTLRDHATKVDTPITAYSVTGIGTEDGGDVIYPLSGSPIPSTKSIIIQRIVPYVQETDISNESGFQPESVEDGMDFIVMQTQQLADLLGRAVLSPPGEPGYALPYPESDRYIGWNHQAPWKLVNKSIVALTGYPAGDAGLDILAMDTADEVRDYLDVYSKAEVDALIDEFDDNLEELNNSTGKLHNSVKVDQTVYVIATGQSNMLGHSFDGGDRSTKNINVHVFEAIPNSSPPTTVGWKTAGPGDPNWPFLPTGNSLAYQFCDRLQRQTGKTVCLVMVAAGGQPIAEWLPGGGGFAGATGAMWGSLSAAHTMALDTPVPNRPDNLTLRQQGRLRADYFLWHQGEADANYRPVPLNAGTDKEYKSRFNRFINAAIDPSSVGSSAEAFIWADQTPILIGELFHGGTSGGLPTDDRNVALRELEREHRMVALVSSRNLGSTDGLHFTGSALCIFGDRYFERRSMAPKVVPRKAAAGIVDMGGGYVKMTGTVTVPASTAAPGQTITFPSLNGVPIVLEDTDWIPSLTVTATGASTATMFLVQSKTSTGFNIVTGTGGNQTFQWQVIAQLDRVVMTGD